MTRDDAYLVMAHAAALWPLSVGKWTRERTKAVVDGIARVNVGATQAMIALDDEMVRTLAKAPTPSQIVDRVRGLVKAPSVIAECRAAPAQAAESAPGYRIHEWPKLVRDCASGACPWSWPSLDAAVAEYRKTGVVPPLGVAVFGPPKKRGLAHVAGPEAEFEPGAPRPLFKSADDRKKVMDIPF